MFTCYSRNTKILCSKKDAIYVLKLSNGITLREWIYKQAWRWDKVTCPKCLRLKNTYLKKYPENNNPRGVVCKYIPITGKDDCGGFDRLCKSGAVPLAIPDPELGGTLHNYYKYPAVLDDEGVTCPKCLKRMR